MSSNETSHESLRGARTEELIFLVSDLDAGRALSKAGRKWSPSLHDGASTEHVGQ